MVDMTKQRGMFVARVLRRRSPCREHFSITIVIHDFPAATPGQFVQILCRPPRHGPFDRDDSAELLRRGQQAFDHDSSLASPLLRRPFSIGGLRRHGARSEIDIIGRVVGVGTVWLNALQVGDEVDVLGPLGNGFSLPSSGARVLLVAGGVGVPPILWWGAVLREKKIPCEAVYGVRRRELLPATLIEEPSSEGEFVACVEEFAQNGIATLVTTEDGSCGLQGLVTDGMLRHFTQLRNEAPVFVYACGPDPMLKAVARMCIERGISCELSLERMMGCGMGTCQSCVVSVRDDCTERASRYALCCSEGPVFNARNVIW